MKSLLSLIAIQLCFSVVTQAQNVALPKPLLAAKVSASGMVALTIQGVEAISIDKIIYMRRDVGTGATEVVETSSHTTRFTASALKKGAIYWDVTAKPSKSYQYRVKLFSKALAQIFESEEVGALTPPDPKLLAVDSIDDSGAQRVDLALSYENTFENSPFEITQISIYRSTGDFKGVQDKLDVSKLLATAREQAIEKKFNISLYALYEMPCEQMPQTKSCVDLDMADNTIYNYLAVVYFKGFELPFYVVSNKIKTLDKPLPEVIKVPSIEISKSKHILYLRDSDQVIKKFPVTIGTLPGRKLYADNASTPEGQYRILGFQDFGKAQYYKAFDLDYPNLEDRKRYAEARKLGQIPQNENGSTYGIGGEIQIHGATKNDPEGVLSDDWTRGCISLRNSDMDQLSTIPRLKKGGTTVVINP